MTGQNGTNGRVALLSTGLDRGGAELHLAALAKGLKARGWEVSVLSLRGGELAAGLNAHAFPKGLLRFRPQILPAHLYHANVAARLARLILPVPVVISTVHSIAESGRNSTNIRWRDLAYRFTDALADATVFVSTAAADRHLSTSAVSAGRTQVIPNGIDTALFHPDPDRRRQTREALGLHDEFVWLAAGRLMWKKNYPLMLDAMRQQQGVLLIAGEGPDAEALRTSAPANVRFLGARSDIPDLMNAADAVVLSSGVEGLPLVLLEAAASGLPCVATAVGGVPEAVLDGRTGFVVPPGDAPALSAAMTRLASLAENDRRSMSAAAREYAQVRFAIDSVVDQWESLYRTLLTAAEDH
jgi:glycosyltransferase involved in cell wall biosynthesis